MRPQTVVPDEIALPFPVFCDTEVIKGFGRGSSELGIPTANIPVDDSLDSLETGIYYGWCSIEDNTTNMLKDVSIENDTGVKEEKSVYPMVMSVGWNPFYKNERKAAEVHIIHKFSKNFYGSKLKIVILGYIRPELDYTTKEALIEDINLDIQIALKILDTPACQVFMKHLRNFEVNGVSAQNSGSF